MEKMEEEVEREDKNDKWNKNIAYYYDNEIGTFHLA